MLFYIFFFQAEDGIRDGHVTGVQTCALPIFDFTSPKGRTIKKLIENNISVYAAHTNLDIAEGGVHDLLANSLSIKDTKPLVKTKSSLLYKIIVSVPKDYLSDVKQAVYNAGAEHIGNYSNCSV